MNLVVLSGVIRSKGRLGTTRSGLPFVLLKLEIEGMDRNGNRYGKVTEAVCYGRVAEQADRDRDLAPGARVNVVGRLLPTKVEARGGEQYLNGVSVREYQVLVPGNSGDGMEEPLLPPDPEEEIPF